MACATCSTRRETRLKSDANESCAPRAVHECLSSYRVRCLAVIDMRKVKWIFFAYLAVVALIIVGIGASSAFVRSRDPNTLYTTYASDIKTLDPVEISDVPSSNIGGQVFECLYNYAYG